MDITAIITKSIAEIPPDEPRQYIGASSIGNDCSRAIWYSYVGADREEFPARLRTTFEIGKRLETLPLDYLEKAGFRIVRPAEDNDWLFFHDADILFFQGHADGLLLLENQSPAIVEIKTAKNSSFMTFKNKGLKVWSSTYYSQIQSYMGMSGYPRAVLIALNKDTSEFHHEWVEYDDIFYHEMKMRALSIGSTSKPPDKINRSPLYFICKRCSYKATCHG